MHEEKCVLIAILTGNEDNTAFLMKMAGARKVVVAHIIDSERVKLSGNELRLFMEESEELAESIQNKLRRMGKHVKVYREWGKVAEKIKNIAQKEGAKEVWVHPDKAHKATIEELRRIKEIDLKVA